MEERILLQQTKMKKIILYKNGRKFSSDPSLFIISKIKKLIKIEKVGITIPISSFGMELANLLRIICRCLEKKDMQEEQFLP